MKTALCFRFAQTLLHSDKLSARGQFLANAVHEANAAKARMNLLRKQFLFRASLGLGSNVYK
jgi:hypothetical protein